MSTESPPAERLRLNATAMRPTEPPPPSWILRLADWSLVGAFLALTFLLGVFPLRDTDFWWHLRTGDLIRQTGNIPSTDPYLYGVENAPWIDLHWIFQVGVSWLYQHAGIEGLNLAKCIITCLAVFLLISAKRREWPLWVMLLAWLPALLVLGGRMYVRPETLSLLYLSAFLAIISRWDRFPALALLLPVIQIAWVNTQGLFVFGPIVLGFGLIDAMLRPAAFAASRARWWRWIATATVLTAVACVVNPYGIRGALYPLELASTMRNPIFTRTIAELTPIPEFIKQAGLRNLPLQLHIATMILGALSFLLPMIWVVVVRLRTRFASDPGERAQPSKRAKKRGKASAFAPEPLWRLSLFRFLLFVAFSVLSWQATRNSHQFAAVVGTVTAWNFGEWASAIRRRRMSESPEVRGGVIVPRLGSLAGIAVVFVLVASGRFYTLTAEGRTIGLGVEPLWFPFDAVKFAGRPEMPQKFLGYHNGTDAVYEYFHGPARKVFADARLEVVGPDVYQYYMNLSLRIGKNEPGWERSLDEVGRPIFLADNEHHAHLAGALLGSQHWRCVWFDPVAMLFVHDSYERVVQQQAVDFGARHYHPDPATDPQGSAQLVASAKALLRASGELIKRGRFDATRALVSLGLYYAHRTIVAEPNSFDCWRLAGLLEMLRLAEPAAASRRYAHAFDPVLDLPSVRATYALHRALAETPDDQTALAALQQVYELDRGMHEAALPLLDRLIALPPAGELRAKSQAEYRAQRVAIERALGPEPTTRWENLSELDRIVTDLLDHGRAASAARVLEGAYPTEPRPWAVTDRIATLHLHLGDPSRARAVWNNSSAPPSPALRVTRAALTYLVEGDLETARAKYHEALKVDPNLFEANYGLAVLERDAGHPREALHAAKKAAAAAPHSAGKASAQAVADDVRPYVATLNEEDVPDGAARPE